MRGLFSARRYAALTSAVSAVCCSAFVFGCNGAATDAASDEAALPAINSTAPRAAATNASETCGAANCDCPLLQAANGEQVADPTVVEINEFSVSPHQLRVTDNMDVGWSFSTTTYANGVSIQFYVAAASDLATPNDPRVLERVFSDALRTSPGETQIDTRVRHCKTYPQLDTSTPGLLCGASGKYLLSVSFDQPAFAVLEVCSACATAGFSTCARRAVPLTFLSTP